MKIKLRGLQDIASIMQIGMTRRPRTQNEIFNELAQLNREKERLYEEREKWQERVKRIEARLSKIEKIEKPLQQRMEQMAAKEEIDFDLQDAKQIAGKGEEKPKELIIKY